MSPPCRGNAVHAHPAGVIHSQLAREGHHRALGGAVRKPPFDADQAGHRSDVHDCAVRCQQQRHGRLRDQEHAFHVDAEQPLEVGLLRLFDSAHQPDARVVHQNVERGKPGEGGLHRGLVGNIEEKYRRAGKLRGKRGRARLVDIHDCDRRARPGQHARGGFADPAGAAGNQGLHPVKTKWRWHEIELYRQRGPTLTTEARRTQRKTRRKTIRAFFGLRAFSVFFVTPW